MITEAVDIAGKSVDFIDNLITKIEKYRQIRQDTTSYLRMLYLEVVSNLEVLQTIDFNLFDKLPPNDPKVLTLLNLLQTNILESVFFKTDDQSNAALFERLKKRGKVANRNQELTKSNAQGEERKVAGKFIYENVLQAISFVVIKTELLKKYTTLSADDVVIIRQVRLRTRLVNIYQRLLMIKSVMDQMDEIKEMAR
jgi:hypothetical protein